MHETPVYRELGQWITPDDVSATISKYSVVILATVIRATVKVRLGF